MNKTVTFLTSAARVCKNHSVLSSFFLSFSFLKQNICIYSLCTACFEVITIRCNCCVIKLCFNSSTSPIEGSRNKELLKLSFPNILAGVLMLSHRNQCIILTVINTSIYYTTLWLHTLFEKYMQLKLYVCGFWREKNI